MELPPPPPKMNVTQSMEGVRLELVAYRPSRLGQLLALLIGIGALVALPLYAAPAATMLGLIFAGLIFLLSGTVTGPPLVIQLTPLTLRETVNGQVRSWPLEELRDIELERWSVLERRMGQIRFSTVEGSQTIGGGNRWVEMQWLGTVLRELVRSRRAQIEATDPGARMEVRPPAALLQMIKH